MKKPGPRSFVCLIAIFALSGRGFCEGEGQVDKIVLGKTIALVNIDAIPPETFQRLSASVEELLGVPIRAVSATPGEEQSLVGQGRSCINLMTTNDACFVALVQPSPVVKEPCILVPNHGWAAVNVGALNLPATVDDALYYRIEKQIMQCIAHLFGVGFSADPHAVNRHVTSVSMLDGCGRTFCPPTQADFFREAQSRGLRPIKYLSKKYWRKRQHVLESLEGEKQGMEKEKADE